MKVSIDDVLALDPKEFMIFIEPFNFQETKNLKVLLEIELERAKMLYEKYKASDNLTQALGVRTNAVIISERLGVCNFYLSRRGVDLSIFKSDN